MLGVEKLIDPNVEIDEKVKVATGILVETFVKVPFARPVAEQIAGRFSKIMLRKREKKDD